MSPSCGELVANPAVIHIGGCNASMSVLMGTGSTEDDYYAGQRLRDRKFCPVSCGACENTPGEDHPHLLQHLHQHRHLHLQHVEQRVGLRQGLHLRLRRARAKVLQDLKVYHR